MTKLSIDIGCETFYQHYSYNRRVQLKSVFVSTDGIKPETAEVTCTYKATVAADKDSSAGGFFCKDYPPWETYHTDACSNLSHPFRVNGEERITPGAMPRGHISQAFSLELYNNP